jgi:hypothetical protein
MKSATDIVFEAQLILGAWLTPGRMTDREALDRLVALLEGPDALALAIAHGRIPAETEAQAEVMRFLVRRANR